MSSTTVVQRIRWQLDVVDKGATSKLLREDRKLRRGLQDTDRQYQRMGRSSSTAATRQVSASQRSARAHGNESRAARTLTGSLRGVSAEQRRVISTTNQLAGSSNRATQNTRAQARAERELTAAQRARARASKAAAGAAPAASSAAGGTAIIAGGAATLGIAALGAGVAAAGSEYTEAARTAAATNAVIKSTGSVAGVTARDVERLSDSLSRKAGVDDELIGQGANLLLTFTQVRNEVGRGNQIFDRTTGAALDMSAAFKAAGKSMEVSDATLQLGKALNDPIKGYTRLQRIGVSFSASQVKQIENFGKAGDKLGAQKVILREVEREFGGAAAATAQPIDRLKVGFGNLAESIGGLGAPTVNRGINAVTRFFGQIEKGRGAGGRLRSTARSIMGVATGATEVKGGVAFDDRDGDGLKTARKASRAEQLAARAREVGGTVVDGAKQVGAQLVDALQPAVPFLQNVLLPLLVGIGKGVMASVVGAFKVVVPVIKVAATALGWVGERAKPLRGVLEGVGTAIGFVFSGPILKGLSVIPKLGIVFKVLAIPVRAVTAAVGLLGRGLGAAAGWIGRTFAPTFKNVRYAMAALGTVVDDVARAVGGALGPAFRRATAPLKIMASGLKTVVSGARTAATWVGTRLAGGVRTGARAITTLGGRVASAGASVGRAAKSVAGVLLRPFRVIGSTLARAVRGAFSGALSIVRGFGDDLFSAGKRIGGRMVKGIGDALKGLGRAVVRAFGAGAGFAADIGSAIRNWINDKTLFGNSISLGPVGKVGIPALRRGGRISQYAEGGRVPILAAGGEVVYEGGQAYTVPGDPTRDGTLVMARPGAEVYTGHGQQLLAAGATRQQALAAQLPHFNTGGIVDAARAARRAGLSGSRLVTSVAIAGPESRYKRRARLNNPPTEDSRGYWQINTLAHRWAARQNLYDPDVNARAMMRVSNRGTNWNPWTAFTKGTFRAYLDRARAAVIATRGGATSTPGAPSSSPSAGTRRVPVIVGRSSTRGGLLDDAFGSAFEASRSGQRLSAAERLRLVREAASGVSFTREISVPGKRTSTRSSSSSSSSSAGGGGWRRPVSGPVTSGFGPRNVKGGSRNHQGIDFGVPIGTAVRAARAGQVTSTGVVGGYGNYLTMNHGGGWGSAYAHLSRFSTKPGRRVGAGQIIARSGNTGNSTGPHLHFEVLKNGSRINPASVMRMRAGGTVGGRLGRGVSTALSYQGGSLAALLPLIEDAGMRALDQLRRQLDAQIKKGGPKKTVTRLQQILDLVDTSIGDRAGRLMAAVDRRKANVTAAETYRGMDARRRGLAEDSPAGLREELAFQQNTVARAARQNMGQIRGAIKRAQKAGDRGRVAELQEELRQVGLELDESITRQIELRRDIIRAAAQERVDAAQFLTDSTQNALAGLDARQRLARTGETAGGMEERAGAIQGLLIPQLVNTLGALQQQHAALTAIGDVAGARQAWLNVQSAGNDITNAMADAADLIRQAAEQRAQDLVDAATHQTTMQDLALQRLELEQRLAGTFDFGGQQRADLINAQILPALRAELVAMREQERVAKEQGDEKLARQIAEQIYAKENEFMQKQLDALEQVADNTSDRKVGGTTGFRFGDETLTDAIIGVGNGS